MRAIAKIVAAASLAALLGGCSNDPYKANPFSTAVDLASAALERGEGATARVPVESIERVYAATSEPFALVTIEDRSSQALILQIESNGPYKTFSTSARQVFVLRQGMITSTRGIGGDLMSSDVEGLLALVSARQSGTTRYNLRFLNGEEQIETLGFDCDVAPSGAGTVAQGRIRAPITRMSARCIGPQASFTNVFMVDSSGYILRSRQWLGDFAGYVTVQTLRN